MPTINDGSKHFQAVTYTGNGSTNTITGFSFQPDFVWIKGRSGATDHAIYDAVRGTTLDLASNTTAAETTQSTGLTAFNSTGFTLGALSKVNTNGATYVAWGWKAGGTGVSNTSGTITSTVSANTSAGFSVVTFTSGSPGTVGHGLGVAPSMIILKSRNNASGWSVYHSSIGNTGSLNLQTTAATNTSVDWWSNTSPTSSVFSIGANIINGWTWVGYCFAPVAGYSAAFSYTGNGSTDGPMVYLGFRPRWLIVKNTGAAEGWYIYDTSRDGYNVAQKTLSPNASGAEGGGSYTNLDILSNGFKFRTTDAALNAASNNYIGYAVAENPFKTSRAR